MDSQGAKPRSPVWYPRLFAGHEPDPPIGAGKFENLRVGSGRVGSVLANRTRPSHTGRKYKGQLVFMSEFKRPLYCRPE